jgi:hypothetical protein
MSVVMVETYVVKAEKVGEFDPALEEFLQFKDANPGLFAGVRSWGLHRQEYGGVAGMYAETWEFDDLAAMEEATARIFADEKMKGISRGFHQLVDPATFSASIWRPIAIR